MDEQLTLLPTDADEFPCALQVLGDFRLDIGRRRYDIPLGSQRLLAFLALSRRSLARSHVAGVLWPDVGDHRAAGNLRSALWRLPVPWLVASDGARGTLHLDPLVRLDLDAAVALARRWIGGTAVEADVDPGLAMLQGEILPDWYDDWLDGHRERFRQLRLHGLEAMAEQLGGQGRFSEALQAALAAVEGDPLRESAQRALISVHVAEGNTVEALRQLRRFEQMLHDELGIAPGGLGDLIPIEARPAIRPGRAARGMQASLRGRP
jgi:DNA-binding SARP family transcriptional activator